ncbi:hypothetical protein Pcaca05_35740 [Pectobacterium carotovorum subsp. carotovorum]|nr:hypothetical protein Pcaca05_35740 [Pectobacterium carotovorum subsp. carotovorum]
MIGGVIITDMYHPVGSKFEQSPDKRRASVISIAEPSNGWGRERYVTLQFESLPVGNGKYIVGLLCYYDSNGVPGLNTPILVDLDS